MCAPIERVKIESIVGDEEAEAEAAIFQVDIDIEIIMALLEVLQNPEMAD